MIKILRPLSLSKTHFGDSKVVRQIIRVMKLTAILLTIFCLQVAAHGYGQGKITLSENNTPVVKIFKSIKKQAGVGFVYTDELLERLGKVSIYVSNATLDDVLQQLLPSQLYTYSINDKIVVIEKRNQPLTDDPPQLILPIDVKGKITDEAGNPVAATVTVKGSSKAVATNENGEFVINDIQPAAVLIITAVNIETLEVKVNGRNDLGVISVKIKIKEESELVFNTGYQKLKPNETNGSFDRISSTLLSRQVSTDILSKLEGIGSGIYFSRAASETPQIFIRGLSTINAETAPLIVVDNFPYDGDINNINPNDVESVTLLKDAAAAAQWGARAGNGVIVITTKKGKYNEKFHLSVNSNVTVQTAPDIFYDRSFLNARDFINVEKFLFSKGFYSSDLNNTTNRPLVSPVVEILNRRRLGQITAADSAALIGQLAQIDVRDDISRYLYQSSIKQQYALSFSGGNSNINYMMGLGYDKGRSSLVGDETERATVYTNTRFKPVKQVEIEAGINYTFSKFINDNVANEFDNPSAEKSTLYPYARLADENGNALPVERNYRMGYTDTAGGGLLLDWKYRPLDELRNKDRTAITNDILMKLGIKYQVTKQLSLMVSGQLGKANTESKAYFNTQTYYARDQINRFSQRNGNTIKRIVPYGGILDKKFSNLSSYAARAQVNYDASWNNVHQLTAIAGAEVRNTHTDFQSNRVYGYNDDLTISTPVDYVNKYPIYGNLGVPNVTFDNVDFSDQLNRFVSLYSNASYIYLKKYSVSGSVRKDASNLFGINSNQRWNPFWSAAAGWKISGENFYHIRWLPFLKLRFSYGYAGNINNGLSGYAIIKYSPPQQPVFLPEAFANPANPDLRWEKVGITNIGLDFETTRGRITGSIEYYQKRSVDLLAPAPTDASIGTNFLTKNVAHLTGHGMDLKLNALIVDKEFKWVVQFLFNYVTNKVTRYLLKPLAAGTYVGGGTSIQPLVGQDPYAVISYKWGGLDPQTGDPIGYLNKQSSKDYLNITKTSSFDDLVIHGSSQAPFHGSLLNTISWKNISVSAVVSYKFHYYFRRNTISYSALYDNWSGHVDFEKRWQKPGDERFTTVPSMDYPANADRQRFYQYSEATVENAGIIRLEDINISYNPDKLQLGKYSFKPPLVYIYVRNVGTIWRANKLGLDPDYGLPLQPSVSFGIKAGF